MDIMAIELEDVCDFLAETRLFWLALFDWSKNALPKNWSLNPKFPHPPRPLELLVSRYRTVVANYYRNQRFDPIYSM
jgi:hypothetical protein